MYSLVYSMKGTITMPFEKHCALQELQIKQGKGTLWTVNL